MTRCSRAFPCIDWTGAPGACAIGMAGALMGVACQSVKTRDSATTSRGTTSPMPGRDTRRPDRSTRRGRDQAAGGVACSGPRSKSGVSYSPFNDDVSRWKNVTVERADQATGTSAGRRSGENQANGPGSRGGKTTAWTMACPIGIR